MKRSLLISIFVLLTAASAWASCVEHAVLRDTDYFSSRYRWSSGRVEIKMWDSPSMVKMVGTLTPGAHVTVLDRRDNFIKVRSSEEQGDQVGWISFALVEITFQQPVEGTGAECGVAVALEPEPEKAVKEAKDRKAEGKKMQALTRDGNSSSID